METFSTSSLESSCQVPSFQCFVVFQLLVTVLVYSNHNSHILGTVHHGLYPILPLPESLLPKEVGMFIVPALPVRKPGPRRLKPLPVSQPVSE